MQEPQTDICLGRGEWIIGHAIWKGTPAIIFTPAKKPGSPGDSAEGEIPITEFSEGAVALRFANMDAVLSHLDRLRSMMATVEAASGVADQKSE